MFRHKLYIRYQGRDVYAVFEQGQTVFIGQLHDCKEYIREVTKNRSRKFYKYAQTARDNAFRKLAQTYA